MTVYKNKWNSKVYKEAGKEGKSVVLEREDGSRFTINTTELNFSYYKLNSKN